LLHCNIKTVGPRFKGKHVGVLNLCDKLGRPAACQDSVSPG
jgi:hypothetical protein